MGIKGSLIRSITQVHDAAGCKLHATLRRSANSTPGLGWADSHETVLRCTFACVTASR